MRGNFFFSFWYESFIIIVFVLQYFLFVVFCCWSCGSYLDDDIDVFIILDVAVVGVTLHCGY